MADPVASVEKIVKLGLKIKQAVDTVRKNEEVCREITKRVLRFSDILSHSQLQQTGMLDANPAMAGALEDLEETLERALELVTACQGRSTIRRLSTARELSRQLRGVKDDILNQAMLALFAINTHTTVLLNTIRISIHGGAPTIRQQEGTGPMEISHSSHSTEDVRYEQNSEENNVLGGCEALVAPFVEITLREFRLSDLNTATNGFSDSNIIGQGGIATVYKGVLSDGSVIAIKKFRWEPPLGWGHTYEQLVLASKLEHKNVVKALGYAQEAGLAVMEWWSKSSRNCAGKEREYIWVEEYVPKGTLHEIIHCQEPRLEWSSLIRIIEGIAQGVNYLHEQRVIHLDLKPTNIVLDSHMNPKITDFEAAKVLSGNQMKHSIFTKGTFQYIAPEYLTGGPMSTVNDVVVRHEHRIKTELDEESLREAPVAVTVVGKTAVVVPKAPQQPPASAESDTPHGGPPAASSCLGSFLRHTFNPPAYGEDYTIPQALVSVDMLVLFLAIACGAGGTLTAIDNMGQIGQSLGYPPKSVDAFVSLISVWNYAGRVAAGYASEALLQSRHRFPRPLALTLVLLASCAGHLLIAFGVPRALYAASVLTGFCYGAQWPLLYAVISELFGLRRYPTLYNLGAIASPVGAYVLNVRVAGRLYDAEAARQHGGSLLGAAGGGDDGMACVGVECFRRSFLIITAATVGGALVSLVLVWRTRDFYRGDIYGKFRDAAAGEGSSPDAADEQPNQAEWRR